MQDRDFGQIRVALDTKVPQPNQNNTLKKLLSAIEQNDFQALPQYLADDIELHIHGVPGMSGSWKGLAEVLGAVEANFRQLTEQKPEVVSMIQEGDAIAVRIRETGRFRESGKRYETRGVVWYTLDGDRVKKVEEFLDGFVLES